MPEYIEREAAIHALRRRLGPNTSTAQRNMLQIAAIEIRGIKAADVAPVRRGQWIRKKNGFVCCSECNSFVAIVYSDDAYYEAITGNHFCYNCGADMSKEPIKQHSIE